MVFDALQGTKFSPNNVVLYESLGSLLKDYRQWRKLTQERLAELIRVGVRELRNWEADRRRVSLENLHDISEITGIPMQVCVALNANQPIWYSLRKRLFMYSSMEETQLSSPDFFRHHETCGDAVLLKKVSITKGKHIDMILSCHQDLYGSKRSLQLDIIKAAASIIPDYNTIIFDNWGHYVGHHICLPITIEVYQELKKQKSIEDYLTSGMISDIIAIGKGVFFLYSTFAVNASTAYWMILDSLRTHSKIEQKELYLIASHTGTKESTTITKNLGMVLATDYEHPSDEVFPVIHEISLANFDLSTNERSLEWKVEKLAERTAANKTKISKQIWSPANSVINQASSPPLKKYSTGDTAGPDALTVGRNVDALPVDMFSSDRVKRNYQQGLKAQVSKFKIAIETCPNIKCMLYGKSGESNIISNGTYRSKDGTILRRFICKKCGKSFCSRTSNIFYGLRSPEEKVLEALKLLLKGLSLRRVAEIIGNDYRTVSSWLKVAAEQNEKINAILITEMMVTQIELDTLWAFVKSNSLRHRPVIGRPR